jgi:hypothetical protein
MAFQPRIPSFGSTDSGYESGVIEVFDEPRPAPKITDYAKDLARHTQHRMAMDMEILDTQEYQQEIIAHMLKVDVSYLPQIASQS